MWSSSYLEPFVVYVVTLVKGMYLGLWTVPKPYKEPDSLLLKPLEQAMKPKKRIISFSLAKIFRLKWDKLWYVVKSTGIAKRSKV